MRCHVSLGCMSPETQLQILRYYADEEKNEEDRKCESQDHPYAASAGGNSQCDNTSFYRDILNYSGNIYSYLDPESSDKSSYNNSSSDSKSSASSSQDPEDPVIEMYDSDMGEQGSPKLIYSTARDDLRLSYPEFKSCSKTLGRTKDFFIRTRDEFEDFGYLPRTMRCFVNDTKTRMHLGKKVVEEGYTTEHQARFILASEQVFKFESATEGKIWKEGVSFGKIQRTSLIRPFYKDVAMTTHEFAHHYIATRSAIGGEGEEGAINESIADVFGIAAQHYTHSRDQLKDLNWVLGKIHDPKQPNSPKRWGIRNMENPGTAFEGHSFELTDSQVKSYKSPRPFDEKKDHGHVHSNSGIPNHAFYLVCTKLGMNSYDTPLKIWDIATRSCTKPNVTMPEFAEKTIKAAKHIELNAQQKDAIHAAWGAVDIPCTQPSPPPVRALPAARDVQTDASRYTKIAFIGSGLAILGVGSICYVRTILEEENA